MAQKDTDIKKIQELIEVMKNNDLVEVEIKHGDDKILIKRSQGQQPTVTAVPVIGVSNGFEIGQSGLLNKVQNGVGNSRQADAQVGTGQQEELVEIKSSIVGTFYTTPSPDSAPFVEIGSEVEPNSIVCIIEAMKVMNEIKAETTGTIAEILVKNGQAVEYGQVLFKVKPD